jgi:hypothetical protein
MVAARGPGHVSKFVLGLGSAFRVKVGITMAATRLGSPEESSRAQLPSKAYRVGAQDRVVDSKFKSR